MTGPASSRRAFVLGGLAGLAEEEPVPPAGGELGVAAAKGLPDRHRIHHHQGRDRLRMVQGGADGHVGAAVVTGYGEALIAQRPHQRDAVACHRPFGVGAWSGLDGGLDDWP
jgi:hypothetical protein